MSLKDLLREKATSSRNARLSRVLVELDGEPQTIGVLQPSLAQRRSLLSIVGDKADAANSTAAKLAAVIECAVDPESRERLFNAKDRDVLLEQPAADWLDKVADEVFRMMRGPSTNCAATKDEKPCGGALVPGAPLCPWCGAEAPSPAEVARKNS